jgi:methionine sulfoxide reductase heme-binding subunit
VTHRDPTKVLWWLVSRASGIVALVLISVSVLIGLAMATKVLRRPKRKRVLVRLHEHIALIALVAIALHGLALLGDQWLKPGLRGIAVPFAMGYRPQFTGLGIIAGYLALLLGPSFYLRRRIGARRWRQLHRATVLVWVFAAIHTLGAGSDGGTVWLRAVVLVPGLPVVYMLALRVLQGPQRARTPHRPDDARAAEIQPGGRAHPSATNRTGRRPLSARHGEEPQPEAA